MEESSGCSEEVHVKDLEATVAIADRTLTERHDLRVETRRIDGRNKYFIPERSRLDILEPAKRVSRVGSWGEWPVVSDVDRETVTFCSASCSKENYALRLVHMLQAPINQHYL